MNYLAHAYLSFSQPEILTGNMISDFVKGRKKFEFSSGIQNGIALHRMIDTFTDEHAATKEAKQFLKPAVGAYSGAFIDVAYDHFLANDENEFTDISLKDFAANTYSALFLQENILPEKFLRMLPYMSSQDWLYNYKTMTGAEKSFGGLAYRAVYLNSSTEAFFLFQKHYGELLHCYRAFFPDVKIFAWQQFNTFITQ